MPWQGEQTQWGCWGWAESALYVAAQRGSTAGIGCGGAGIGLSEFPPVEQTLIAPKPVPLNKLGHESQQTVTKFPAIAHVL